MKKCPLCAEDIQDAAIKCRYCGSELIDVKNPISAGLQSLKQQKKKVSPETSVWAVILALIIVGIIVGPCCLCFNSDSDSSRPSSSSSSTVDLNAKVSFSGVQFVISNNDSFDWTNVKLDVNSKTFSSGYVLKIGRMSAGETYTVGAMQFAKSGGDKFNPFTHKPLNFSIWCDTPRGKGFYYAGWE